MAAKKKKRRASPKKKSARKTVTKRKRSPKLKSRRAPRAFKLGPLYRVEVLKSGGADVVGQTSNRKNALSQYNTATKAYDETVVLHEDRIIKQRKA